jgi:flagellar basal body P-ring formation protein FlgA
VSTAAHGRAGRRRFEVQLVQDGTVLADVPVTARTEARGSVVVAKQAIARGAVVTPDDVRVEQRNHADVPDDALTAPEEAIGKETKVALAAAEPLPRAALVDPPVIKKGDLVTMLVETSAMRLSATGEALEPGPVGGTIKVRNRTSKQAVAGRVVEHGLVVVEH